MDLLHFPFKIKFATPFSTKSFLFYSTETAAAESFAGTPIAAPNPGNPVLSAPIAALNPGSFPGAPIFSGAPITALSPSSVTLADDRPPQGTANTEPNKYCKRKKFTWYKMLHLKLHKLEIFFFT
jgi:hypothetical protein